MTFNINQAKEEIEEILTSAMKGEIKLQDEEVSQLLWQYSILRRAEKYHAANVA